MWFQSQFKVRTLTRPHQTFSVNTCCNPKYRYSISKVKSLFPVLLENKICKEIHIFHRYTRESSGTVLGMYRTSLIEKEYKINKTHPHTNIPPRLHIHVAIALLTSSIFLILIHRSTLAIIISLFHWYFNWGHSWVKLTSWIYSLSTMVKIDVATVSGVQQEIF